MKSMLSLIVAGVALGVMSVTTAFAYDGGIRPSSGTQDQIFEVWGTGLTPGLALDINFMSPDGTIFSTAAVGKVVVVDPDGTVSFLIRPTEVFQGESKGIWEVQSCVSGTDDCDEDQFEIR
jgi:hypothetical protein